MFEPREICRNALLRDYPRDLIDRLWPSLVPIRLVETQVLYERREPQHRVYFIERGLVSVLSGLDGDDPIETGMMGRESAVGAAAMLDDGCPSHARYVVRIGGSALAVEASVLQALAGDDAPVVRQHGQDCLHAMLLQATQTALCNTRHELIARLARWLLSASDRVDNDEMPLTQEFLAALLGTRRTRVTAVALQLQSEDCIRYSRGRIKVLDRGALESRACSCYDALRREIGRVFARSRRPILP